MEQGRKGRDGRAGESWQTLPSPVLCPLTGQRIHPRLAQCMTLPHTRHIVTPVPACSLLRSQTMHPDKSTASSDAGRQAAAAAFRAVQQAYEVLRDSERRAAYDQGLLLELDGSVMGSASMSSR